jgi:hypothetical protein
MLIEAKFSLIRNIKPNNTKKSIAETSFYLTMLIFLGPLMSYAGSDLFVTHSVLLLDTISKSGKKRGIPDTKRLEVSVGIWKR